MHRIPPRQKGALARVWDGVRGSVEVGRTVMACGIAAAVMGVAGAVIAGFKGDPQLAGQLLYFMGGTGAGAAAAGFAATKIQEVSR